MQSYSCQVLMKLEFSRLIFEKSSNIKFQENPSSGRQVVSCGQLDRRKDRRTDRTKLKVALRNSVKEPSNHVLMLGNAHYHITLISYFGNFYTYEFIFLRISTF
jgi:hypothetical protein